MKDCTGPGSRNVGAMVPRESKYPYVRYLGLTAPIQKALGGQSISYRSIHICMHVYT